jgi:class 3 adenylate cyclase
VLLFLDIHHYSKIVIFLGDKHGEFIQDYYETMGEAIVKDHREIIKYVGDSIYATFPEKVNFCIECEAYPCEEIKKFQSVLPHRLELWESQERIKEAGYEQWYKEMVEHYSCPKCNTINSAYDMACRKCGHEPSCAYVNKNKQEIVERLSKRK